jgi:hypothetical protein
LPIQPAVDGERGHERDHQAGKGGTGAKRAGRDGFHGADDRTPPFVAANRPFTDKPSGQVHLPFTLLADSEPSHRPEGLDRR